MRGQTNQVWVPASRGCIVPRHAFSHLDQGMLNVPGVPIVSEVLGDLPIGKRAAEPGVPPEQERHEHDQPAGDKENDAVARRHPGSFGGQFGSEVAV
jgi:hypothetical protein